MTRPTDSKHFVIAFRCGRLANRLVMFANFIGFAEEHGHRVSNVTFHSYADQFETTGRDIYCRYPVPERRSVVDCVPGVAGLVRQTRIFFHAARAAAVLTGKFSPPGGRAMTLHETPGQDITPLESPEVQAQFQRAKTVFVYGWRFRAPTCVKRHAGVVRSYFKPIAAHAQAVHAAVHGLRQNADLVIGVHIRRGDYQGWRRGQCFFEIAQYAAWMRDLAAQLPGQRAAFLVCSDEPRTVGEFPGLKIGFGPGFPVGDLYALAACDFILGPLSTFSQWASFYGNKPLLHLRDKNARVERDRFCVSDLLEIP